ncbi:hypothetical protein PR048_030180 [Dryococelus australis]|uniref:Uncharacterized protein n=1 Tax=Dryococelus australis TaxID=614101 RepID=A0ABQ9G872_9NEOP|nr:hypothetical protein PR048_030180 [Dryococelus australis]
MAPRHRSQQPAALIAIFQLLGCCRFGVNCSQLWWLEDSAHIGQSVSSRSVWFVAASPSCLSCVRVFLYPLGVKTTPSALRESREVGYADVNLPNSFGARGPNPLDSSTLAAPGAVNYQRLVLKPSETISPPPPPRHKNPLADSRKREGLHGTVFAAVNCITGNCDKVKRREDIWTALNFEVSRADEASEWKGRGNGISPRKPADRRHRPARFPHAKKTVVTRSGIESGSPWWEASKLTAQPDYSTGEASKQKGRHTDLHYRSKSRVMAPTNVESGSAITMASDEVSSTRERIIALVDVTVPLRLARRFCFSVAGAGARGTACGTKENTTSLEASVAGCWFKCLSSPDVIPCSHFNNFLQDKHLATDSLSGRRARMAWIQWLDESSPESMLAETGERVHGMETIDQLRMRARFSLRKCIIDGDKAAPAHNVCSVIVTPLESRRATSCGYNSSHPVWHALYECLQDIHGDSSPFLLGPFHELSNGFWPRPTSPHPAIQFVPKMFYRVEASPIGGHCCRRTIA